MVSAFPLYKNKKLIGIMESYQSITVKRKLEDQARKLKTIIKLLLSLQEVGEGILMLQDLMARKAVLHLRATSFTVGFTKEELLVKVFLS